MLQGRGGRVAAALAPKYARLCQLRQALGDVPPDAAGRAQLRALAADWPGALRELDTLPTAELQRRAQLCAEGGDEPWMAPLLRYHQLMRAALALRRGAALADVTARTNITPAAAGDDPAGSVFDDLPPLDEAFAAAVAQPPHGRLMVVVCARVAEDFAMAPAVLWNLLFPPRGRVLRDYRG